MKKTVAAILTLFAVTAYGAEKAYPGDSRNQFCPEGQVWSVQLQCDTGTRSGIERIWPGGNSSMPGVESCGVVYQGCQPIINPNNNVLRRGREATDSGHPMTIVIFGVNRLLDKPGL